MSSDEEDDAQLKDELRELQELLGVHYRDTSSQAVRMRHCNLVLGACIEVVAL